MSAFAKASAGRCRAAGNFTPTPMRRCGGKPGPHPFGPRQLLVVGKVFCRGAQNRTGTACSQSMCTTTILRPDEILFPKAGVLPSYASPIFYEYNFFKCLSALFTSWIVFIGIQNVALTILTGCLTAILAIVWGKPYSFSFISTGE